MTAIQMIAVTVVSTLVCVWLLRAGWRYAVRVREAVRHAERFDSWASYREDEYRRLSGDHWTLHKRVENLEAKS